MEVLAILIPEQLVYEEVLAVLIPEQLVTRCWLY